jgi:type II secretion system protein N
MRFPSIRLPAWGGDRSDSAQRRRFLLYTLYTTGLFLIFLIVNFPYHAIVDRALDRIDLGPVRITVDSSKFAWWHGLELSGVRVARSDISRQPLIELSRTYVMVGWRALLGGELASATIDAALYGGWLDAEWRSGDGIGRAAAEFDRVQLARHRGLNELFEEGQVYGMLSGLIEGEMRKGDLQTARAEGELQLLGGGGEALVYQGMPLPELSFDKTAAKFVLQGGRLEIEEFVATGPDLEINASGQIGLRQPLRDSVLNLKVTLAAVEGTRDEIKGLARLFPRPKGRTDAPTTITGTLSNPRAR